MYTSFAIDLYLRKNPIIEEQKVMTRDEWCRHVLENGRELTYTKDEEEPISRPIEIRCPQCCLRMKVSGSE
jgi:hypothetical protein